MDQETNRSSNELGDASKIPEEEEEDPMEDSNEEDPLKDLSGRKRKKPPIGNIEESTKASKTEQAQEANYENLKELFNQPPDTNIRKLHKKVIKMTAEGKRIQGLEAKMHAVLYEGQVIKDYNNDEEEGKKSFLDWLKECPDESDDEDWAYLKELKIKARYLAVKLYYLVFDFVAPVSKDGASSKDISAFAFVLNWVAENEECLLIGMVSELFEVDMSICYKGNDGAAMIVLLLTEIFRLECFWMHRGLPGSKMLLAETFQSLEADLKKCEAALNRIDPEDIPFRLKAKIGADFDKLCSSTKHYENLKMLFDAPTHANIKQLYGKVLTMKAEGKRIQGLEAKMHALLYEGPHFKDYKNEKGEGKKSFFDWTKECTVESDEDCGTLKALKTRAHDLGMVLTSMAFDLMPAMSQSEDVIALAETLEWVHENEKSVVIRLVSKLLQDSVKIFREAPMSINTGGNDGTGKTIVLLLKEIFRLECFWMHRGLPGSKILLKGALPSLRAEIQDCEKALKGIEPKVLAFTLAFASQKYDKLWSEIEPEVGI